MLSIPVPGPRLSVKIKPKIYYGELGCQAIKQNGQKCNNLAYFKYEERYLCGVHSQKAKLQRQELPKNPNKAQLLAELLHERRIEYEEQAMINRAQNRRGQLKVAKMGMMQKVTPSIGYQAIFPNFKHGNRVDGLGLPSLSPMSLGPILHNQPNLPPALNLENMHHSNKCFESEIQDNGQPKPEFYETQRAGYLDPIPHRHKITTVGEKKPMYSVWHDPQHGEMHLDYVTSRQIYCHYYALMVQSLEAYKLLISLLDQGYNLEIWGYDGYPPGNSMEEHYLDPSRAFGHEMVLYTMLSQAPETWPWVVHRTLDFYGS